MGKSIKNIAVGSSSNSVIPPHLRDHDLNKFFNTRFSFQSSTFGVANRTDDDIQMKDDRYIKIEKAKKWKHKNKNGKQSGRLNIDPLKMLTTIPGPEYSPVELGLLSNHEHSPSSPISFRPLALGSSKDGSFYLKKDTQLQQRKEPLYSLPPKKIGEVDISKQYFNEKRAIDAKHEPGPGAYTGDYEKTSKFASINNGITISSIKDKIKPRYKINYYSLHVKKSYDEKGNTVDIPGVSKYDISHSDKLMKKYNTSISIAYKYDSSSSSATTRTPGPGSYKPERSTPFPGFQYKTSNKPPIENKNSIKLSLAPTTVTTIVNDRIRSSYKSDYAYPKRRYTDFNIKKSTIHA